MPDQVDPQTRKARVGRLIELDRELARAEWWENLGRPMRVLAGVSELLARLEGIGDLALGLLTGNIVEGARLKLRSAGLEERFDGCLDIRLGRIACNAEHDLVVLGRLGRLLGDDRRQDHVVVREIGHFSRSSIPSTAERVSTSV